MDDPKLAVCVLVEDGEIPKEKMSIQAIRDWANANPSRVQSLL